MTFEQFHNGLRLLLNIDGDQLVDVLTPIQADNFFSNQHMFFIRADDTTARKLWDVMYPKPKEPAAGEAAKDAAKVVDLDAYRRVIDLMRPVEPARRKFDYWYPPQRIDFEYDTGRVFPLPAPNTAADVPARTFIMNGASGDVTARAG